MVSLMSRSVIDWPPTLASVPLLEPNPRFPDPKFEISARAKPPMMATTISTMINLPTLDFETRRKKVSIGFRKKWEEDCRFRSRAGAHQAPPLGRSKRQANGLEETR